MLYMLYMLQHYVNSVCVMFIQAFSVRCITYLITALDEWKSIALSSAYIGTIISSGNQVRSRK